MPSEIDTLLAPFKQFGVNLGLTRIQTLLGAMGNPHIYVPFVHVAGTNGKGSVCAYLSSILSAAGYTVGRYTSPHLVNWNERICINDEPIDTEIALAALQIAIDRIDPNIPRPTQFEIVTAAMWLYFAQARVDIAVIEVGLGGRLDATNICDRPLVSVITSIDLEHCQQLGDTIAKIAREKAGILKPNCPAIIGPLSHDAIAVVKDRARELDCPLTWVNPSVHYERSSVRNEPPWVDFEGTKYPLPLLGEIQLTNSALAIATIHTLRKAGWTISDEAIVAGMGATKWLGRIQWTTWQGIQILIDGAHNPASAIALRQYVDTLKTPISWVMGMLDTKTHREIFQALLRPSDKLYLVTVPNHNSADPVALAKLARSICPRSGGISTCDDLSTGLTAAAATPGHQIVLCGSLYLVGHFLKQHK
jgi:dihydrofolate synthase / folylpolyglutamate synthase